MVWSKEVKKAYMSKYYRKNKAAYQKKYRDWCKAHPGESRAKRGKGNKTPEEIAKNQHDYYVTHKANYYRIHYNWCAANPERFIEMQRDWRERHKTYHRDYARVRVATVDPLIFQFLDNGFDNDIESFVCYLRNQGYSEQHIRWFKTDIGKYILG